MPSALVPLANITLSTTQASVTFSSISQSYRDLMLVVTPLTPTTGGGVTMRVNGDSGSNYSDLQMYGTGTAAGSYLNTPLSQAYIGQDSSTSGAVIITHILDYSATDKHKNILSRSNQVTGNVVARVDRWANTAAITSIQILNDSQSYSAGATFALYGVSA